jgi:hypothetical protein
LLKDEYSRVVDFYQSRQEEREGFLLQTVYYGRKTAKNGRREDKELVFSLTRRR